MEASGTVHSRNASSEGREPLRKQQHFQINPIEERCRRFVAALVAAFVLAACGEPATPSSWLVYDQVEAGTYALTPASLSTLKDIKRLAGDVAHLYGNGHVVSSSRTPTSEADYRASTQVEDASLVTFDYYIDGDTGVANDFDGLMMITVYHHLELAQDFFATHGVDRATVRGLDVYYRVDFGGGLLPIPVLTDNAAYAFTLDAFLLPPRFFLAGGVPLFANRGVVAHEYGHAVFNRLVHHDRRGPAYLLDHWESPAVNEMRSLDEGLADIFGALITGDPNFIVPSFSGSGVALDRDLQKERHYGAVLATHVQTDSLEAYDPYPLGSVVAAALWSQRLLIGESELADLLVQAEGQLGDTLQPVPVIAPFITIVVGLWPAASRSEACEGLRSRLDALTGEIACP